MLRYYENDIYPIGLVLTDDMDALRKHYVDANGGKELEDCPESQATSYFMTRRTTEYHAMAVGICFNVPITARLAAHEGFHAAYMMMECRLRIPLTDYSDEAWAYLIGWIAECIDEYRMMCQTPCKSEKK